jgi:hypothetical protein
MKETLVKGTGHNKRMQRRPRSESRINLSMPFAAPLMRSVRRLITWLLRRILANYITKTNVYMSLERIAECLMRISRIV